MTINIENLTLSDFDLPFTPSGVMSYHDPLIKIKDKQLMIGYLADHEGCDNPLESMDGEGKIFTAHRHSSTHREMQEALGLNSEWEPDLELVYEHIDKLKPIWIRTAASSREFQLYCENTAGANASLKPPYYLYRARKYWAITDGEYVYGEENIDDFEFTDEVKLTLWHELREQGLIGDPDAVLLDCYEHSGVSWSISGDGMQCRWDTASGAGVWVPDESARASLDERVELFMYGFIHHNGNWTRGSGKKRYYVVLDEVFGGETSEQFKTYHEANDWLFERSKSLKLPRKKSEREALRCHARRFLAKEYAKGALELYNDWLNGRTYGIVCATFDIGGTPEEPVFEFSDSDECWGYYGDDNAMEELRAEMGISSHLAA